MQIMVNGAKSSITSSKLSDLIGVFVAYCRTREHHVVEIAIWVINMQLEWVDSDDGP